MKVRQCTSFFNIMTTCMPNSKIDIDIMVCTNQNMFDSTAKASSYEFDRLKL